MFNKNKKNNKGFTLVELLVVIAIIGILAVVAVPSLLKNIDKAKVSDIVADYSTIKSVVVSQYTEGSLADATYTKAKSESEFIIENGKTGTIYVSDLSKEPEYELIIDTNEDTGVTKATLSIKAQNPSIATELANKIGVDSDEILADNITVPVELLK